MIRRFNDYSFMDEESLQKIANVVNNQRKLVKITDNLKEANITAQQLQFQGYNVDLEQNDTEYHIFASPRQKISLADAKASGQFKKIAFDRYTFEKNSNLEKAAYTTPISIQHYNFDDGTIWRVMTAKDGKQYLVKEVDEKERIVRQPNPQNNNFKNIITASLTKNNSNQLTRLCKILYNNPDSEFVNDLVKYSSKSLSMILASKLDNIVTSELEHLNITSPQYQNNVKEKIIQAIDNDQIFNRKQISTFITQYK